MKKPLLYCCLLQFLVIATYAQFPKNISTHPDFPVNDEFLPLINNWKPAFGPHTNNSFLNNSIRWYSPAGSLQMNFHPHDRNGKTTQTT
jgi:hypothetical protein